MRWKTQVILHLFPSCLEGKGPEDIVVMIKNKKWGWAGHARCKTDNWWTTKVIKWQPKNYRLGHRTR